MNDPVPMIDNSDQYPTSGASVSKAVAGRPKPQLIERGKIQVCPEAVQAKPNYRDSIFASLPKAFAPIRPRYAAFLTLMAEREKRGVATAAEKAKQQRHLAQTSELGRRVETVEEIQRRERFERHALTNAFVRGDGRELLKLTIQLAKHLQTVLEEELAEELQHDKENAEYLGVEMPPSFGAQIFAAELTRLDSAIANLSRESARVEQLAKGEGAITQFSFPTNSYILREALKHLIAGQGKAK